MAIPGDFDLDDPAVKRWQESQEGIPTPVWGEPELAVWMAARKKMASWRAPGKDGLQSYWWKVFHQAANFLWEITKEVLSGSRSLPVWFVEGRTVLILA